MRLEKISVVMENALTRMSEGSFQQAGSILSEYKNNIREELQKKTSSEIQKINEKLNNNSQLTIEDLEMIRVWIVGDADSYTKMENNFQDWLEEFKRLEKVLQNYENKECTKNDLFKLIGILEDAIRVNYDIANFLEKQERIRKFENATKDNIDLNREMLIKILESKLQSPDY